MDIDSAVQHRLSQGASLMNTALQMSTDLNELNRKLVVYWSIATHMLPYLKTFPLLVLKGPMGTGKSECLSIVALFSHNAREFPMRSYTSATIRDEMVATFEGTAIIEEADQGWLDGDQTFERILSDRYQRNTGKTSVKHKNQRDDWTSVALPMFGATALHRRIPFADAALDGRSITITFRGNFNRGYAEISSLPWIQQGSDVVHGVTFQPVEIDRPATIAPRIFNSYHPIIATSRFLEDNQFQYSLTERLELETTELKEAQSLEPDGIVLRAILNIVSTTFPAYSNIKLSTIVEWVLTNHGIKYAPRQIGGIARTLNFVVKESHGVGVVVPSPVVLVKACRMVGYVDESEIEDLKRQIPGWSSFDDFEREK